MLLNIRKWTLDGGRDIGRRTADKARAICGLWRQCSKRRTYCIALLLGDRSRYSDWATGWWPRIGVRCSADTIHSPPTSRPFSGVHPASYTVGTGVPSAGVERPGREANYSPPLMARLRMSGAIPPLPPCYILEYNRLK